MSLNSTDLRQVPDHPAKIVSNPQAAVELRRFESEHQVVFAALASEALLNLHEAYEDVLNRPRDYDAVPALLDAVNALLGLDNQ